MYIKEEHKLPLLKGMRELLDDPKHWTKGGYGIDNHGVELFGYNGITHEAVCWCMLGAAYVAQSKIGVGLEHIDADFDNEVGELLEGCGPIRRPTTDPDLPSIVLVAPWNDDSSRTHEDVINALDCAIERVEKAEQNKED